MSDYFKMKKFSMRGTNPLKGLSKLLLSALVIIAMVFALAPTNVFASETPNAVYLDGIEGNDENTGASISERVKTFARAKELLSKDGTIYIVNTVYIYSDEEWSLPVDVYGNAKVIRTSSCTDFLIQIDAGSLTLDNIIIDGGAIWNGDNNSGQIASGSVIVVNGGSLILNENAIIQNNDVGDPYPYGGGLTVSNTDEVVMNKGSVIKNCKSSYDGGGVLVNATATFKLNGGTIKNNKSAVNGGGVAVGNYNGEDEVESIGLIIKDGEISGNSARSGGGLFVMDTRTIQMDNGSITENTSTNVNASNMGGGGIYISGTFNMNGGSITKNKSSGVKGDWYGYTRDEGNGNGAGVLVSEDGVFNLKGDVNISNNTRSGENNNVCLTDTYRVTKSINVVGAINGNVGVSLATYSDEFLVEYYSMHSSYPKLNDKTKEVIIAKGSDYEITNEDLKHFSVDKTIDRQGYGLSLDSSKHIVLKSNAKSAMFKVYKDGINSNFNLVDSFNKTWVNNKIIPQGEYKIYMGREDTGFKAIVDDGENNTVFNLWTVNFGVLDVTSNNAVISATYDGKSINDGDVVLAGKQLIISVQTDKDDIYDFTWSVQPEVTGAMTNSIIIDDLNARADAFCIVQYKPVVISIDDWSYGDTAKNPEVTGAIDGGTITYHYTGTTASNDKYDSDIKPTDAGKYTLTITIGETSHFSQRQYTKDFEISKKDITNAIVELDKPLTYNNAEQTQEIKSVKLDGQDVTYLVTGNKATDMGNYELTITGTGNYEGTIKVKYVIGGIILDIVTEDGAPKTELSTSKTEVIQSVLTAEELAKVDAGELVDIWLEVKDASVTISEDSKKEIESAIDDYSLGMYLDISMFKKLSSENQAIRITDLDMPITVKITVPDSLLNTNSNINRKYYIVRNHDGNIEIIETTYDETTKTLTFDTDKFSDYAIIYADIDIAEVSDETTPIIKPTDSTNDPIIEKVETGDNINVLSMASLLMMSIAGGYLVLKKREN